MTLYFRTTATSAMDTATAARTAGAAYRKAASEQAEKGEDPRTVPTEPAIPAVLWESEPPCPLSLLITAFCIFVLGAGLVICGILALVGRL